MAILKFFYFYFLQPNSNPGVEDVTITDEKDPETASQTGSLASERGIDIGRVGSWATDFEKLLTDPIGLRTFAVSFVMILYIFWWFCWLLLSLKIVTKSYIMIVWLVLVILLKMKFDLFLLRFIVCHFFNVLLPNPRILNLVLNAIRPYLINPI